MTAPLHSSPDLRRLGIQAAAGRYCGQEGAHAGAPWFSSYSRRQAYVLSVNERMDQLWRDIYQGAVDPQSREAFETLRGEFDVFMKNWQRFVAGLSIGGMMLPSTEDYAHRIDQQIEEWSQRFKQLGGKTSHAAYKPPAPPPGATFPWKTLLTTVLVVATVGGVVYVGTKLPDVPGPRYA